jgi:O-antigen/teichoic acid export membrane protein
VVPLIALAYVIYGVSMISSLGMYLTGKNHFVALITIFCAGLNIALNFWLIPIYGMIAAAANTVISFAILDVFSNLTSRRYYNIPYEHFKIIRLFLFSVLFFVFIGLFNELEFESRLLLKIISIISFPVFVVLLKYFTRNELILINGAIKKWIKPSAWKDIFKNKNTG